MAPNIPSTANSWARIESLKRRFARQDLIGVVVLFVLLLLLPLLPFVKPWMASQATLVIVYVIAAQGVSILTSYTGLVTVGHGGFLAIGAYAAALLIKHLHLNLLFAIVAGGAMAAFVGLLLGLVFLRLAGPFMAIGTLGFAFFVGALVNNVPLFEGREGITLPKNELFGVRIGDFGFYWLAIAALALITLFKWRLIHSSVGRALKALRDAVKAAESSGVSRLYYRTLAFTISAFITGVAGALNGLVTSYVSAETYSDIWYSVDLLVAVVVGGSAMMMGPFVGGLFVASLPFVLENFADFSFILKGVALIAVLRFAPAGVCDLIARPLREMRRRMLYPDSDTSAPPVAPVDHAARSTRS
jgi:branched-chain amino acid transport system permease protein